MSWYTLYRVGIQEIDDEHAAVDSLIERFPSVHAGGRVEYVTEIIRTLVDHFRHEEECCRHLGMALPSAHMQEHERLTGLLLEMRSTLTETSAESTVHAIQQVLRTHLSGFDKQIGADQES